MALIKIITLAALFMAGIDGAVSSASDQAEDVDVENILEEDHPGRLMKERDPLASVSFHEEEPIIKEFLEGENPARLVRNRGPVTKKVAARGSHSRFCTEGREKPGCEADFSAVAWKLADGTITGLMEDLLKSGESVKVEIDCLLVKDAAAIFGGVVKKIDTPGGEEFLNTRAYVKVLDKKGSGDDSVDQISSLSMGWANDTDCGTHDFDKFQETTLSDMRDVRVMVCSRRSGEDAWVECVEKFKSME